MSDAKTSEQKPQFETTILPSQPDVIAPDGSEVRILLALTGGSFAHFTLNPHEISIAVAHRTVEEIWYFISGKGEIWRKLNDQEEIVKIETGVNITIPVGTKFQFRNTGDEPLTAVAITMPPWTGEDEAYAVEGIWQPNLPSN